MRISLKLRDGLFGLSDLLFDVICILLLKTVGPFLLWVLITATRGVTLVHLMGDQETLGRSFQTLSIPCWVGSA